MISKKNVMISKKKRWIKKSITSCTAAGIFHATTRLLALAALLLCSASGPGGLAQAQVFTSNTGQPAGDSAIPFYFDHAQAFTTGSNSDGYTLASVDIYFTEVHPNPTYSVGVWTSSPEGRPSIRVGSLSLPATLAVGANTFTTSGIDLDAETTYLVVVDVDLENNPDFNRIHYTASGNEDAVGMSGWSLGNSLYKELNRSWETGRNFMRIRINGPLPPAPVTPTPDAPTTPATPTTPKGISDPPQYLRATASDSEVMLTWDAPFFNGGSEIAGYAYRYKESDQIFGATASASWNDIPGRADARSHTITSLTNGLAYRFEVRAENERGGGTPARTTVRLPVTVGAESEELPEELTLMGNYPNPFNPETVIDYALPQTSHVRLAVYDMTGRTVAVLVDGMQPQGRHAVRFNIEGLPTGTYVYRLSADAETLTRTMTLVR